jgi:hypothetical protein
MGETDKDTRTERLKAALRENLKRRKAQARARGSAEPDPAVPDDGSPMPPKPARG